MSRSFPFATSLLLVACAAASAGESPSQLRTELAKIEKQYIELYNKTNTNPQFEIVCKMEKATGTQFATRVCRPRYVLDAMQNSASDIVQRAINSGATSGASSSGPGAGATPVVGATGNQVDKDTAYKQNLMDAQLKNPELMALGKKHDELQKQLDDAAKK
ncbi:MAG: hypothetical protein WDO12_02595 [Pseudomonadota bacterium]